jgi:hypothetical protein
MTAGLHLSLFNFRNGGLQTAGGYDFAPLAHTYARAPSPDVIAICEAKFWSARGRRPFQSALRTLGAAAGRTYVGELFSGALATAVVFDPNALHVEAGEELDFADKHRIARFLLRTDGKPLQVLVEHWSPWDGDARLARAKILATYGPSDIPTIIADDLNSTASGPHLPAAVWSRVPAAVRDHKGRQRQDGTWEADTRAVDRLIGRWDPSPAAVLTEPASTTSPNSTRKVHDHSRPPSTSAVADYTSTTSSSTTPANMPISSCPAATTSTSPTRPAHCPQTTDASISPFDTQAPDHTRDPGPAPTKPHWPACLNSLEKERIQSKGGGHRDDTTNHAKRNSPAT